VTDRSLIYPGDPVKALGSGRVAGYLVRYGSPDSHDVQGDFFTPTTDFGLDVSTRARVVYHHGIGRDALGSTLGRKRIGTVELRAQADGLWAEGSLDLSVKGVDQLYADIEAGKVGWSSGSVDRLVERADIKSGVREVRQWPIIEASLSYTPVDPRNRAVAIKSLTEGPVAGSLVERSERLVADAEELAGLYAKAADQRQADGRSLSGPKREALRELADAFDTLYDRSVPRPTPEQVVALQRRLLASRI
jgi:phage head maturation protease